MSKKKPESTEKKRKSGNTSISLKELAKRVNLSPTSLSLVLNDAPAAVSIPQETKDRIFEAAAEHNYRPNYFARSLRAQRSFTFGVIVPELSDGYAAMVLGGVESVLTKEDFSYFTTTHLHREDLLVRNPQMMIDREVEAIIALDTPIRFEPTLPIVCVSGHDDIKGVTNIILDHKTAAELGIGHLYDLGHSKIAVIKGQDFSSDTEVRWETISQAAENLGIPIEPDLCVQLEGDSPSPETGYIAAQKLLETGKKFTAIFAFNDMSAIGAIRAFRDAGLEIPQDISVLGFDDIHAAKYHNPALTTIKQPLFEMGRLAAQTLLDRLNSTSDEDAIETLTVAPELIVRASTVRVRE